MNLDDIRARIFRGYHVEDENARRLLADIPVLLSLVDELAGALRGFAVCEGWACETNPLGPCPGCRAAAVLRKVGPGRATDDAAGGGG